jgi:hypothetical protein
MTEPAAQPSTEPSAEPAAEPTAEPTRSRRPGEAARTRQPNQPDAPPAEDTFTFHDADAKERDFDGLVEEKGDFQEAVDATLRGEEPEEPGQSPMPL